MFLRKDKLTFVSCQFLCTFKFKATENDVCFCLSSKVFHRSLFLNHFDSSKESCFDITLLCMFIKKNYLFISIIIIIILLLGFQFLWTQLFLPPLLVHVTCVVRLCMCLCQFLLDLRVNLFTLQCFI